MIISYINRVLYSTWLIFFGGTLKLITEVKRKNTKKALQKELEEKNKTIQELKAKLSSEPQNSIQNWVQTELVKYFSSNPNELETDFTIEKKGKHYLLVTSKCQYCKKPLKYYKCQSYHEAKVLGFLLNSFGIHPDEGWCKQCTDPKGIYKNFMCPRCDCKDPDCDWCYNSDKINTIINLPSQANE